MNSLLLIKSEEALMVYLHHQISIFGLYLLTHIDCIQLDFLAFFWRHIQIRLGMEIEFLIQDLVISNEERGVNQE